MKKFAPIAATLTMGASFLLSGCGSSAHQAAGCEPPAPSDAPAALKDSLTPQNSPQFASGTDMERIAKAGKMTVAVKLDVPGFGLKGLSPTPSGFDVTLSEMIAARMGVSSCNIKWVEGVADLREEMLERGEVDLVAATYSITDERKARVTFAGPYYVAGSQLMVRVDDNKITGPESLKADTSLKVCTNSGSTPSVEIKPYLGEPSQLVLFDVVSKCGDALRTGQIDAVVDDNTELLGLVEQSDNKFKLVGDPFSQEPFGLGVPKGDVAYCQFLNDSLEGFSKSGAYKAAWEETGGKVPGAHTPELPKLDQCR